VPNSRSNAPTTMTFAVRLMPGLLSSGLVQPWGWRLKRY
jgi:hypothetical protein